MTGQKYILTSEIFRGEISFSYNLKGNLAAVEFTGVSGIDKTTYTWLWQNLPLSVKKIKDWQKRASNFKVTEVPVDLSFNRFWLEYRHKVGKKKMAENNWKKLSRADKIAALMYIKKLRTIKKSDGTDMPYPTTYLNQKYWEV